MQIYFRYSAIYMQSIVIYDREHDFHKSQISSVRFLDTTMKSMNKKQKIPFLAICKASQMIM